MTSSNKLVDGAIAGIMSRTITAPVDRLRIVMQAASAETKTMGVFETFSWIGRTSGVRGYWLGNGANCIKIAPDQAIMYATFSKLKEIITQNPDKPSSIERLLAGGISGTFTSYCVYPLDRARVVMASAKPGTYNGLVDALRSNASQGIRSMYFGVSTSAMGNFPFCACQLGMAEMLKDYCFSGSGSKKPGMVVYLISGSMASSFALTCTYPIWLLRVKMQTSGMPGADIYVGVLDCISKTWSNGGMRAMYRGLIPSLAKVIPANSISYTVYKTLEQL